MITFEVSGRPVGQGAHSISRSGHIYDRSKGLAAWRSAVIAAAQTAHDDDDALDGPISVTVIFTLVRPLSHYSSKGLLKAGMPTYVTKSPDLDHLLRAIGDSLTMSGLLHDDKQIVHWDGTKLYGAKPSARVLVRQLDEGSAA